MVVVMLLLILTGVIAFVTAAIVGWQVIAVVAATVLLFKLLKRYVFRKA